jgi:predicted Zn finger-like uncharacterized protein
MQTTCPECRTTFRVSQEHLGARRGLVRCGTCNAVFNAYDTLLPELESPPAEAMQEADRVAFDADPEPATPSPTATSLDVGEADADFFSPQTLADYAIPAADAEAVSDADQTEHEAAFTASLTARSWAESAAEAVEDAASLSETRGAVQLGPGHVSPKVAPQAEPDILLEPLWPQPEKTPRTWKFWFYLLLSLLLAGLLGLQAAYFLRAELAAAVPMTRPLLQALCRPLDCSVPLPRQLTKAAIAASALEHDPENKSRVRLSLLLANRSGQTQAWPQITLTLSDVRQAPVAQQVFRPQTYLPQDVKIAAGMAADAEQEIRLDLDIGNLVASGYTLNLSYP